MSQARASSHHAAISGLIIGCIIFGLGSLIVKAVPLGAYAMAFWRIAITALLFGILMKLCGFSFPKKHRAKIFAILSGCCLAFDLALWHESIHAVGPGIATLLNSLQIFFLAAIGYFWFGERQTRLQIISLFLAIIGVVCIASLELAYNQAAPWGFIAGLVSAQMLAGSMVFIRKTHEVEPTRLVPLMVLVGIGGSLALILPVVLIDSHHFIPTTFNNISLVLIYGIVMQGAWAMIAYAIPKLSLSLTGLLILSEPIAALLIDAFWLHKPITALQWGGMVLTMLAIYLGSPKSQAHA